MAAEGTLVKNKIIGLNPEYIAGQFQFVNNAGATPNKLRSGAKFAICTGGSNGYIPDVTYNQTSNVVLIPDYDMPHNLRCYVTRFDVDVRGSTAWTGGTSVTLCDSNGAPGIYMPTCSLVGLGSYIFPDSDVEIPITSAVTAYNVSTGAITLTGTPLIASAYSSNCPATVIAGTGIGQSFIVASNTSSVLTPVGGASIFPVPLDTTSVIAIWYWASTTCTTTVETFSNASFTTNALDNGFNIIDVAGATPGKNRPIASNTSTAATVAYAFNTAPTAGDLMEISNNASLLGAIDMCVSDKWAAFGPNKGLQIAVNGTFTAGSPLRCYVEGFFSY